MQSKNGFKTPGIPTVELEKNEEEKPESEILHFDKPDFDFIPKNCQWRQQGPYLVCYSCILQHAVFIGMEKMITGMNEKGEPILKNRDFKRQA